MPVPSSIFWTPADLTGETARATQARFPIFIKQSALAAIHDHGAVGAGAASVGFLIGSVFEAPDGTARYVVVESTISLPWRVTGDHTKSVVLNGLAAVKKELRTSDRRLLGWYHSHPSPDASLSADAVDTHETFFDQPWHVALVVASGDRLCGGVYQHSAHEGWASERLPFYELLDEKSVLPDGRKVTDLTWENYHTAEEVMPSDRVPGLRPGTDDPHRHTSLLFPDDVNDRAAPTPLWRFVRQHATRYAVYGLVGVLAIAGLVNLFGLMGSKSSPPALPEPRDGATPSPLDRIDRAADTLALALTAYDVRARLFAQHQMGCPDLSRGLIDVENRWIAYNLARKGAFALDSVRDARDRTAYTTVDATERRFEATRCPRP